MIWKEFREYQTFFLLYVSNTASTLVAQELRFYLWYTLSSIDFNCVKSCSIDSDELLDHQNSSDI